MKTKHIAFAVAVFASITLVSSALYFQKRDTTPPKTEVAQVVEQKTSDPLQELFQEEIDEVQKQKTEDPLLKILGILEEKSPSEALKADFLTPELKKFSQQKSASLQTCMQSVSTENIIKGKVNAFYNPDGNLSPWKNADGTTNKTKLRGELAPVFGEAVNTSALNWRYDEQYFKYTFLMPEGDESLWYCYFTQEPFFLAFFRQVSFEIDPSKTVAPTVNPTTTILPTQTPITPIQTVMPAPTLTPIPTPSLPCDQKTGDSCFGQGVNPETGDALWFSKEEVLQGKASKNVVFVPDLKNFDLFEYAGGNPKKPKDGSMIISPSSASYEISLGCQIREGSGRLAKYNSSVFPLYCSQGIFGAASGVTYIQEYTRSTLIQNALTSAMPGRADGSSNSLNGSFVKYYSKMDVWDKENFTFHFFPNDAYRNYLLVISKDPTTPIVYSEQNGFTGEVAGCTAIGEVGSINSSDCPLLRVITTDPIYTKIKLAPTTNKGIVSTCTLERAAFVCHPVDECSDPAINSTMTLEQCMKKGLMKPTGKKCEGGSTHTSCTGGLRVQSPNQMFAGAPYITAIGTGSQFFESSMCKSFPFSIPPQGPDYGYPGLSGSKPPQPLPAQSYQYGPSSIPGSPYCNPPYSFFSFNPLIK